MQIRFYLLLCMLLTPIFGCSKKSMSDRDSRREQLRLNAHKKRQELSPLAGNYRGQMIDASGYKQDVSLHLELKDVPETEGGQIDPVLVPTVNGALSLTYGSGSDMELFSFGTNKADYNVSDSRLDVVVSNTNFKDINLSLNFSSDKLNGTWSSPSTSLSGDVNLTRASELNLRGETPPVRGTYAGILEWDTSPFFLRGALTFSTAQDGVDSFHVTASLKVNIPSPLATESLLYEFDSVEFNPLTRQFSIRSENSDLYFVGQLLKNEIRGKWHSKRIGLLGTAVFSTEELPTPTGKINSPAASGTWFGTVVNIRSDTQLPERLLLSFNAIPDKSQPGGLALVGSSRFYYGPFSSNDYLEYRFESIDYQPFTRKIVAVTLGSPKLTIQFDMDTSTISGRITDASLGQVATFNAGREAPPDSGQSSLVGEYNGVFLYDSFTAFQYARISLVPIFNGSDLKLAAAVTVYYGEQDSTEALTYRFDKTDFNSVTGLLTLANESSDVVIKVKIANGAMTGEWYSTALGKMGQISLSKPTSTSAPSRFTRLDVVKGTYQGELRNTSTSTNLPERIMFGLITSVDSSAPRGLKITGNLRLYYGPFDSTTYVELPFELLQLDPYRRTVSGKTTGALRLTVQGNISVAGEITGSLSDDSLGKIGEFEVHKNAQ